MTELHDLIEEFKQKRTSNYWTGYKGVGNLERILKVIRYTTVEKFLANNPDFIKLIIDALGNTEEPVWIADFKKELDYE